MKAGSVDEALIALWSMATGLPFGCSSFDIPEIILFCGMVGESRDKRNGSTDQKQGLVRGFFPQGLPSAKKGSSLNREPWAKGYADQMVTGAGDGI